MTPDTIELLLTRTDRPCANCGAPLYQVLESGKTSGWKVAAVFLGLTCRSCEANGMRLLKDS